MRMGRALEAGDTFLQRANKVRQPPLTRLRELVPPWPFRGFTIRTHEIQDFNGSTRVTKRFRVGGSPRT